MKSHSDIRVVGLLGVGLNVPLVGNTSKKKRHKRGLWTKVWGALTERFKPKQQQLI